MFRYLTLVFILAMGSESHAKCIKQPLASNRAMYMQMLAGKLREAHSIKLPKPIPLRIPAEGIDAEGFHFSEDTTAGAYIDRMLDSVQLWAPEDDEKKVAILLTVAVNSIVFFEKGAESEARKTLENVVERQRRAPRLTHEEMGKAIKENKPFGSISEKYGDVYIFAPRRILYDNAISLFLMRGDCYGKR